MDVIDSKTKREKEIQDLGEALRKAAEALLQYEDLAGFALVVWDSDYGTGANWDAEHSTLPDAVLAEFVKQAILTRQNKIFTNEVIDERLI